MNNYINYLLSTSFFMLSACAPIAVTYKSDPPGATISGNRHGGGAFNLLAPATVTYPGLDNNFVGQKMECITIDSPSAHWPDGASVESTKLSLCYRNSEHTFRKPMKPIIPQLNQQSQAPNINLDDARKKCIDLGFKSGTEQFGKCVLQLSK